MRKHLKAPPKCKPKLRITHPKNLGEPMQLCLVAPKNRGQVKFFYEMISGWLLPGSRLNLDLFITINFLYERQAFVLMLIEFVPQDLEQLTLIKTHLPFMAKEIEFGATSYYQAMQILEMKGMSLSDKSIALQEDIAYLIRRFPKVIDTDIYLIMRLVLMGCSENFKRLRSERHLMRLVQIFYRFYRHMFHSTFMSHVRFVDLHAFEFEIRLPFEMEKKCALLFSISSSGSHEVLELNQVIAAVKELIHVQIDKEDCFAFEMKEHGGKFFYVEIPCQAKLNLPKLREKIRNSVQRYVRPIFMPRNEEEVMKNIVSLSKQLRYFRDIPQVMINFERQTDTSLSFRVVLVRLLIRRAKSIGEVAKRLGVEVERCRHAGLLRKRVPKEASVFTVVLDPAHFLRNDSTLDLYKARFEVYRRIRAVLGDVRDFNGGLIARQRERLEELKRYLRSAQDEILFENFFFSLDPVEYRMVWDVAMVMEFFNAYLSYVRGDGISVQGIDFQLVKIESEAADFEEEVTSWNLPVSSLIRLKMVAEEGRLLGYCKKVLVSP